MTLLVGLIVGVCTGLLIGRRWGQREAAGAPPAVALRPDDVTPVAPLREAAPTPSATTIPRAPVAPLAPPLRPQPPVTSTMAHLTSTLGPVPIAPTKKARKLGLDEAAFRPADDILAKMQQAWEEGGGGLGLAPGGTALPTEDPHVQARMRRVFARLEGVEPGPDGEGADMAEDPAPETAPSAGTLTEAIAELEAAGYGDDLRFADGVLSCRQCGREHPSAEAVVEQIRRFEGQSDPGDETIAVGLRCPHCEAKGCLVFAYGPDADPALAEAFTYFAEGVERS